MLVLCSANQTFLSLLWASIGGSYTLWKVYSHPCVGHWLFIEEGQGGGVGCFLDKLQITSGIGIMDEIFLWLQVFPSLRRGWELPHTLWAHEPLVYLSVNRYDRGCPDSLSGPGQSCGFGAFLGKQQREAWPSLLEGKQLFVTACHWLAPPDFPSIFGAFKDNTYPAALNRVSFSICSFYIPF